MFKTTFIAGIVSAMAITAAYAEENKSFGCTEAHLKQMDTLAAQFTGEKKQAIEKHLQMSKDAFAKGDTEGCLQHMQEAQLVMGISESNNADAAEGAAGSEQSGAH